MALETKVLLALTDRNLSLQLIEKFKNKFPDCPLSFEVTEDGRRAIEEVKLYRPCVVVVDLKLPSINGSELVAEIFRAFSDCQIIVAAEKMDQVDIGLVKIELPILDWEKFINELTNCLPLDFQIQYGLISRNTKFHEELSIWSSKYRKDSGKPSLKTESWIFLKNISPNQKNEPVNAIKSLSPSEKGTVLNLSGFVWAELLVIGIFTGGLMGSFYLGEENGFLKAGIQIFLTSLLIVNGLGFFLLRLFSRARN